MNSPRRKMTDEVQEPRHLLFFLVLFPGSGISRWRKRKKMKK